MRAYRDRPKEKGTFEKPSTRQKMTKLRGKNENRECVLLQKKHSKGMPKGGKDLK